VLDCPLSPGCHHPQLPVLHQGMTVHLLDPWSATRFEQSSRGLHRMRKPACC